MHHKVRCTFCRGKYCNRCGLTAFLNQTPRGPIDGLHSNWVTGDVLACQRPSSRIIKEFDLINQFRKNRITAIVNLEEPFEHPFCGDGINKSGFSYFPEEFMDSGIYYYNFPWEDMCTPSIDQMLSIVKVMSMSVQRDNKVAVHCHAGFGRTGMVIACFLLYFRKMTPAEAIRAVRTQRGKCIEKKSQLEYVYDFARYIKDLQIVFAIRTDKTPFEIGNYLKKSQYEYLHGAESRALRHLPKIVVVLCSLLNEMALHNAELLGYAFSYVLHREQWEQSEVARVMQVKEEINETRDWEKLKHENPRVLVHLLIDWLRHLKRPIMSDAMVERSVEIANISRRQMRPSSRDRPISRERGESESVSSTTPLIAQSYRKRLTTKLGDEKDLAGGIRSSSSSSSSSPLPSSLSSMPKTTRVNLEDAKFPPSVGVVPSSSSTSSDNTDTGGPASPRRFLTPIMCGHEILSLLRDEVGQTIVCILKVAKKLSKTIMYTEVVDIVASACTHRDFLSGSSVATFRQEVSADSGDARPRQEETHGLRASSSKLRREIRLLFHCLALASREHTIPQISAFPIGDDSDRGKGSAGNESQQLQMMKDICALYRKLPLGKMNKVLSALADLYSKKLEVKQNAFDRPPRTKIGKRPKHHARKKDLPSVTTTKRV
eukprot:g2800.t1